MPGVRVRCLAGRARGQRAAARHPGGTAGNDGYERRQAAPAQGQTRLPSEGHMPHGGCGPPWNANRQGPKKGGWLLARAGGTNTCIYVLPSPTETSMHLNTF